MKAKYLGVLVVGIMAVGSFSLFAKGPTPINNTGTVPVELTATVNNQAVTLSAGEDTYSNIYDEMRDMMEQQIELGNLTEEQAKEMFNYCIERMSNNGSNRGRSGFGCH